MWADVDWEILQTMVGYTQGHTVNPTYDDVCSKTTGHAEAVFLEYNPAIVTYEKLLDIFWKKHNPTRQHRRVCNFCCWNPSFFFAIIKLLIFLNYQGNEPGSQYRSGIYFHNPEQEKIAKKSLENRQKTLEDKIVTEILPAKEFYPAEEYHQKYLSQGR